MIDKEHVRNMLDSLHYEMRIKGVNPLVWELYFKLREELLEEQYEQLNGGEDALQD